MTGSDLYLMALGPVLALLAGAIIYAIARRVPDAGSREKR